MKDTKYIFFVLEEDLVTDDVLSKEQTPPPSEVPLC